MLNNGVFDRAELVDIDSRWNSRSSSDLIRHSWITEGKEISEYLSSDLYLFGALEA